MNLEELVEIAFRAGASDLHLQPGYPAMVRVAGSLRPQGEVLDASGVAALCAGLLDDDTRAELTSERAVDLARVLAGVRCRANVFVTSGGVGLALRIFQTARPTLARLNLHPELARFARARHGLVLVAGPTGAGKSSTLAALVDAMDDDEPRHVITLEAPIEHVLRPRRLLVRQREVGRDTPSFAHGLRDALRENPDALVVGELREVEVMRLVLGAAETGHLVLATVHAATCAEALQRMILSFAPEAQGAASAQLADGLVAVVAQRLVHRADAGMRVPECEILTASSGVRGLLRQGAFSKLPAAIESGGADGMFTFDRYGAWLSRRTDFNRPTQEAAPASEPAEAPPRRSERPTSTPASAPKPAPRPAAPRAPAAPRSAPPSTRAPSAPPSPSEEGVLEIPAMEESAAEILDKLSRR